VVEMKKSQKIQHTPFLLLQTGAEGAHAITTTAAVATTTVATAAVTTTAAAEATAVAATDSKC
jgi:hypothetical protein